MQHVQEYGWKQQEEQKRQQEEADAEAAAFAYVTEVNRGYMNSDHSMSAEEWCAANGYDYNLVLQYCNKYGW
mgnify:FL=1